MVASRYEFAPEHYERELLSILEELMAAPEIDADILTRVLKKYPKDKKHIFSKSEIVRAFRHFAPSRGWLRSHPRFIEKLKTKPVRTESGVAPVTVLTKPFPCPGECIFCPNDVRMPKSYLSMEPGAQRAAQHAFDPHGQTSTRLRAFHNNGHRVDKVELIVLGGTWSSYPEGYQVWFIKRCFEAMNAFDCGASGAVRSLSRAPIPSVDDFADLGDPIDGRAMSDSYNLVVSRHLRGKLGGELIAPRECAVWGDLEAVHRENETSACRCVGLSVETRPDRVSEEEVVRLRRLGVTKVQIGYQSLSDEVLAKNKRGHGATATRRAMKLLRQAGFKVHAHWMPNLRGSTPEMDLEDFERIFSDRDYRPDELKIYPCSLVPSAELMKYYESGEWRPYSHEELLEVLTRCMEKVPRYCRLTRIVRDIPSHDILVGNKLTNLRQIAEGEAIRRGVRSRDIRSREIRGAAFDRSRVELREMAYETSVGREIFLELTTSEDDLLAFLRLSLPERECFIEEVRRSAIIREVHVYGVAQGIGDHDPGRPQHIGLGRRLIERAVELSRTAGFDDLAVISSVGTRAYYRELAFVQGALYQHRALSRGTRKEGDER